MRESPTQNLEGEAATLVVSTSKRILIYRRVQQGHQISSATRGWVVFHHPSGGSVTLRNRRLLVRCENRTANIPLVAGAALVRSNKVVLVDLLLLRIAPSILFKATPSRKCRMQLSDGK